MTDAFVTRQPIFERRNRVVGYELLFRDGVADSAMLVDHKTETATLIANSITAARL